jgi:hypothetical protein
MNASSGEVLSGVSAGLLKRGPRLANCSSTIRPVVLSHSLSRGMPAACALDERRPERRAGERRLDLPQQLVDRLLVGRVGADLGHQPLERVAQVPLAEVKLGPREAGTHRVGQAAVVVAHDPRRGAAEGAEERLPVGLRLARERLQAPQSRASRLVAHGAEHAKRDPVAAAVGVAHAERQIVK